MTNLILKIEQNGKTGYTKLKHNGKHVTPNI